MLWETPRLRRIRLLKHLHLLTRTPHRADEFTTGQKLALASGIAGALSNFYATKEDTGTDDTTTETT